MIISVYYVVLNHKESVRKSELALDRQRLYQGASAPAIFGTPVFAASLALPDLILILFYAASMYFSIRYVSQPATDPQQAQMQRTMAWISPVMLGFFGWRYHWPSAMVLYWFSYNILTMGQQFFLLRRYHQPLALIDSEHPITESVGADAGKPKENGAKAISSGNGVAKSNPQRSARSSRSKRKNK